MPRSPFDVLGAMPVGDPAGMRELARHLRRQADTIAVNAARAETRARQARYEGPAAERFRHEISSTRRGADAQAARLRSLASYVMGAADQLERSQNTWQARYRQIEREIAQAARRARGSR